MTHAVRVRILLLAMAGMVGSLAQSRGDMVSERWGVEGPVQHPGTIALEAAGDKGELLVIDLAGLPRQATVYRARLYFSGVNWKQQGFDIVPAVREGAELRPVGRRLEVAPPHYQWLDATEAVQGWAKAGATKGLLWLRGHRTFDLRATYLEIAYQRPTPAEHPPQTSQVQAFYRNGQVFLRFKEVDPPDEGRERLTWAELLKKFRGDYYGPVPGMPGRRLTYQVYCHQQPITAANIGKARLLAEVLPGSAVNTRMALPVKNPSSLAAIDAGRRGEAMADPESVLVTRVAVEAGEPVSPGTGIYVHTVDKAGTFYYAVLSAEDGMVNASDITAANSVGPVRQEIDKPQPILYTEFTSEVEKVAFRQQWYSLWAAPPLAMTPLRYDVCVSCCPELMEKPAHLLITRGGWNAWPDVPRPRRMSGLLMSHTRDQPVDMRMGLHDSIGTIKGFDQGRWQPFMIRRQLALVQWACRIWPIDRTRIDVHVGAWGAPDIRYGEVFAMLHGYIEPELTKGWQCWDRARGIWGTPEMYKGRLDDENPYVYSNLTDWVLANPARDLPFVSITTDSGGHNDEEGWPPYPRFCWAMMQAKQPFVYCGKSGVALPEAIRRGEITFRSDRSLTALAHCSLDDNIGNGDLRFGDALGGQINGWVLWDPEGVEEAPSRWAITLWIGPECRLDAGTVDVTPRRCQHFKARPGERFTWTNTSLAEDKVVQTGMAIADGHGLVTAEKVIITKGKNRLVMQR